MSNNSGTLGPVTVRYGKMTGQYFTQWRIDVLEELLRYVISDQGEKVLLEVTDPVLWHDEGSDFHRLDFKANGKIFEVRLYKVFSVSIDGKDGWVGCLRGMIYDFAKYLREKAR